MLSVLQRVSDALNRVAEAGVGVLMLALVLVVFAQVIFRYIIHSSLSWSDEIARYMLIWLTFLGASAGVKHWAHFGVRAFILLVPPVHRRWVNLAIYLITMVVAFVLLYFGWQNVLVASRQVSVAMSMPMWYVYSAIPTSGVIILVHMLLHFIRALRSEEVAGTGTGMFAEGGVGE